MKPSTISLKEVIGRIKSQKMLQSIPEDTIVDNAISFQRIMGLKETFEEKLIVLDIKNFRAELPDDFYEVIQVRTFRDNGQEPIYFRSMTDNFYQSENHRNSVPCTYKIQGHVLYVSPMKSCKLEVAYRAIQLDDCGFPLIPDNEKYIRALISFVKVEYFKDLYERGLLRPDVLDRVEQDYCFNVGAAQNDMKMPSLDEIESVSNILNSMLPRRYSHYRGYADSGSKEMVKIH